jgi:hypothetical protein
MLAREKVKEGKVVGLAVSLTLALGAIAAVAGGWFDGH